MTPPKPTHEQLVSRYQAGDEAAFNELLAIFDNYLHAALINNLATYQYDSGEAWSKMLQAFWRAAQTYQVDKGCSFKTWLYYNIKGVTAAKYIYHNAARRIPTNLMDYIDRAVDEHLSLSETIPSKELDSFEIVARVNDYEITAEGLRQSVCEGYRKKVKKLPQLLDAIVAHGEIDYEVLSKRLGWTEKQVDNTISRMRRRLKAKR